MSDKTLFGEQDTYLFREGTHTRLHDRLGAHLDTPANVCRFAVWAPNADTVSVIGDFNAWDATRSPLTLDPASGVWVGTLRNVRKGARYKYFIRSKQGGYEVEKTDPFARYREVPPETASIVWEGDYEWRDSEWRKHRPERGALDAPWSIYELHLGSWRRPADGSTPRYRELAVELADYVAEMGFTHVELLPVMEHPYYPSWGYQTTGYFAPTSRYGTPEDFKYLVDVLHRNEVGVILDWVPSHFPSDAHSLGFFDGTYLFEHTDPQKRIHPDWDSLEFNYARGEVQSYLLSSAIYWLENFHADALRVDAVASMLYLNYSRNDGEWTPNRMGGHESLEAVEFLRRFNRSVYAYADVQTIAEESTAWPLVSRPVDDDGLGFGMKWDLGFMHDTLDYFHERPEHRKHHHRKLTFRPVYAFSENFVLPLSHDEVVHGKGSLLARMPGEGRAQFANLRLLYSYMWGQPGKKLLFMGGEFGQRREWDHDDALEWFVLEYEDHASVKRFVADLNELYRAEPALYRKDFEADGFSWVQCDDDGSSIVAFLRFAGDETRPCLAAYNFTDSIRRDHRIGVPRAGRWDERLNSDSVHYGGEGGGNLGGVDAEPIDCDGHPFSIVLTLPPLTGLFLTPTGTTGPDSEVVSSS